MREEENITETWWPTNENEKIIYVMFKNEQECFGYDKARTASFLNGLKMKRFMR